MTNVCCLACGAELYKIRELIPYFCEGQLVIDCPICNVITRVFITNNGEIALVPETFEVAGDPSETEKYTGTPPYGTGD